MSAESKKANRTASEWMATFAFTLANIFFVGSVVAPLINEKIPTTALRDAGAFFMLTAIFWRIKS